MPGSALTFEEAMASRDLDPDRVVRLWRAFGFPDPRSVTRPFTEREVELLEGTLLLADIVEGFEERIAELVADRRGRLVKLIGDEAMFVFSESAGVLELASDPLQTFGATLRAGMATGSVATLRGDYYGDVVNLASRLTSVADPGTVLVSASLAEVAPDDVALADAGSFELKGFDEPVPAFVLRRDPTAGA